MAGISRIKVGLRILGDDIDPNEVSKLLGATPTDSARKGEMKRLPSGKSTVARTGSWHGDLSAQIRNIFSTLTSDLSVWKQISNRYKCDLFCGLFMNEMNEGVSLNPDILKILIDRGVVLALDIYNPAVE